MKGHPRNTPTPSMRTTPTYRVPLPTGGLLDPYNRGGDGKATPILASRGAIVGGEGGTISAQGGPFTLGPGPAHRVATSQQWSPSDQRAALLHEVGPHCTRAVVRQVKAGAWVTHTPHYPALPWVVRCTCGFVITGRAVHSWSRAMAIADAWVTTRARQREHEHEDKRERSKSKTKDKRKHKAKRKAKHKAVKA